MSREILFRGKRTDNGEWVYGGFHKWETRQPCVLGDELKPDEIKYMIIVNSFADWNMPRNMQAVEVIPTTIGEYTGLPDKNGRKIFEGDILKFTNSDGEKSLHIVQWSDEYSGWETQAIDMKYVAERMDFWDDYQECYEVIGNIHDNPELMEGQ